MRPLILFAAPLLLAAAPAPEQTVTAALAAAPVWDGHNDVPEQLRDRRHDLLAGFDFSDTTGTATPASADHPARAAMQTDLARLHRGHVGAQFWSVYVSTRLSDPEAVQATLEQIDVMKRLIARYPDQLQFCTDSACASDAWKHHRIASLLGMEGGHSIGASLAVLRQMHALGARYMTLTHFRNTAWADSATDAPAHNGLTPFGQDVVREMQRLGMLVDLSHVASKTMLDALAVARAPVIFSHSGAQAVDGHPRNVPDEVLDRLKENGGIVMVNTLPAYVSETLRQHIASRTGEIARLKALYPDNPPAAEAALTQWDTAHPMPHATIAQLADHIDHIRARIGITHIGLGGDFDGIDDTTQGMADVSTYPALLTELARRGYSKADLEAITSGNMMRVMRAAESYAATHRADPPIENPTTL